MGVYVVNHEKEFFQQLHEGIAKVDRSQKLILIGDINRRAGSKDSDERITERFIELCEQNMLNILNGYFPHDLIHIFT